ncbi:MAG TPA: sulfatase-like hydrolase/transferase [Solirubrobacteraceae bacterium]|jgi:arylsulfatase A-like enzyme|nr:sulfatase-like hydrolase/transferase [Solirubrobacteraceae bacterium]
MTEQDPQEPQPATDTDAERRPASGDTPSDSSARGAAGDTPPASSARRTAGDAPPGSPAGGVAGDSPPGSFPGRLLDRRTLLKSGLLAGGAIAGGGAALADLISKDVTPGLAGASERARVGAGGVGNKQARSSGVRSAKRRQPPNILMVMVDQLRTPQWFSASPAAAALMPNLARLRNGGVSFANHYTAANDCTPARAALLTGLHTHQTGCMITGGSSLDPGFPTWGTMLREQGYRTYWYGKWHLTHGDNLWDTYENAGALEPYGFAGGTFPSPDGAPGQGWRVDPHIVSQFEKWFAHAPKRDPWCTTVSFVNPHDIAWWYHWSERFAAEAEPPSVVGELPPNFETPEEMAARGKPQLQRSLQDTAQASFGTVPYSGPQLEQTWLPFLDLYLKLLGEVDNHIGAVLNALSSRPDVAANTVILFTSDHGEYGASHGMRGKGAGAYEEAIRVPLIVRDLRGELTQAPAQARSGLTSSVDVAPLMLDIATGSSAWRKDSHYSHIASRHDLSAMLRDPGAPGRPYVLHATDETVTEFAIEPYAAEAPLHVVALRTPEAKYATYSDFLPGSIRELPAGRETELYDYSTQQGRMELRNEAGNSPLEDKLAAQLQRAIRDELREPLPGRLKTAHKRGLADYFNTAAHAANKAAERRRERAEREAEAETPFGEEGEIGVSGEPTVSAQRRAGPRATRRRR